jgi:hypothetical protein
MIPKMKMSDLMFEHFKHALVLKRQEHRSRSQPQTIEMDEGGLYLEMNWDEVHELFQMFDMMPSMIDTHEKVMERIKAKNAA